MPHDRGNGRATRQGGLQRMHRHNLITVLLLLTLALAACANNNRGETEANAAVAPATNTQPTAAVIPMPLEAATEGITITDITGNPGGYLGKQVTVRGEVEEVVHPQVFSLDEDVPLAGGVDNDLLVVSSAQSAPAVTEAMKGEVLTVAGTVRAFITAEIERKYGLGLDPELVVEYEGRPVIIAGSIRPAK